MRPLHIEHQELEGGPPQTIEVRVIGYLDAHTVISFEKTMEELLNRKYHKMLIDLECLQYISSAGIGSLMVLLQKLRRRNGDLVLMQPTPKVYKIMELLGFHQIFHIAMDRDSARAALG